MRTSAVGANKHHGDHDANFAAAADDDETNARTRTIINVDQFKAKAGTACHINDLRKREALMTKCSRQTSRQRNRAAAQAPQREVQDTRKRNNILIHQAPSVKETAGWVGVLDVQW